MEQLERSHTNAGGRERGGGQSIIITFFFFGGAGDNHYFLQQLERRHTNAGREGKGGRAIDYYYFFFSGGAIDYYYFFLFGGVPEIIITSCNSWKGATPTLGGRERGEGNRLLLLFFLWGGQSTEKGNGEKEVGRAKE